MKQSLTIHGAWIRSLEGKAQMLIETDDGWHLVAQWPMDGSPFSEIVEPSGIVQSPPEKDAPLRWMGPKP